MNKLILACVLLLSACTSMNQALSPSLQVQKNDFDGTMEIIQPEVSAASSLSEAYHTLGFKWSAKKPDSVFLYVGVYGIESIRGVAFNLDGNIIESTTKIGLTDIDLGHTEFVNLPNRSMATFVMPLNDFKKLAASDLVKMKVEMGNSYSVSSFGKNTSAVVSPKLVLFTSEVDKYL